MVRPNLQRAVPHRLCPLAGPGSMTLSPAGSSPNCVNAGLANWRLIVAFPGEGTLRAARQRFHCAVLRRGSHVFDVLSRSLARGSSTAKGCAAIPILKLACALCSPCP